MLLTETAHQVADGAGDQEVLLHQAQLFAAHDRVGGIQQPGNVFRGNLLFDGADVISAIEDLNVEILRGAGAKQSQPVHGLSQVADDGHVRGYAHHDLRAKPALLQVRVRIAAGFNAAVQRNADRIFGMLDLEGRASPPPLEHAIRISPPPPRSFLPTWILSASPQKYYLALCLARRSPQACSAQEWRWLELPVARRFPFHSTPYRWPPFQRRWRLRPA